VTWWHCSRLFKFRSLQFLLIYASFKENGFVCIDIHRLLNLILGNFLKNAVTFVNLIGTESVSETYLMSVCSTLYVILLYDERLCFNEIPDNIL
jgi:hypothetical protein